MSDKPRVWNNGTFYPSNLKIHLVSDSYHHYLRLDGDVPRGELIHRWLGHHRWALRRREDHSILQFTNEADVDLFVARYREWLDDRVPGGDGSDPE